MANPTVRQILEDTKRLMAQKQASLKKRASEITGQDPDTIPGAEHDSPTPSEYTEPDPEVVDGTEAPGASYRIEGADDAGDAGSKHTVDADESVEDPTKKPLLSTDADAKTAGVDDSQAALANEILGLVHSFQKRASAETKSADTPKDKVAAALAKKSDKKPAQKHTAKKAGLDLELTTDVMAKIAALVLSTEEGAEMVENILTKVAGAEMMHDTLNFLAHQSDEAEKVAAYQQGLYDAEHALSKVAADNEYLYKMGQAAADVSVDDIAAEGAEPDPEVTEGMDTGDGGDISPEEVVGTLQELVEEGSITPEQGEEILQAVLSDEGDMGGDAGGDASAIDPAMIGPEAGGDMPVDPELPAKVAYYVQQTGAHPMDVLAEMVKAGEAAPGDAAALVPEIDAADAAAADAATAGDSGGDASAEDVVAALGELVEAGEISADDAQDLLGELLEGDAGGGSDLGEKDVVEALTDLVEAGEIEPDDAESILSELSGE